MLHGKDNGAEIEGLTEPRRHIRRPFGAWQRSLLYLGVLAASMTYLALYTCNMVNQIPANEPASNYKVAAPYAASNTEINWCPLSEAAISPDDGLEDSLKRFSGNGFLEQQVERLSAAVNISTVSYDDNGAPDQDPRWQTFGDLHQVIRALFPLIASQVQLQYVNKYGLLYHVAGTNRSLKPMLLMAHQDVVPPGDLSQWTYPPFEAHFDGEWLWGRGSGDCKSNLIGILTAVNALLEQNFQPRRSLLLAFGFDEETGGSNTVATQLQTNIGEDSLAFILDEGGMGISTLGDVAYALPAVAEKGFVDVVVTLETLGGHSSQPPNHTSIGIMSDVILTLEAHPFVPVLDATNPVRGVLQCETEYSPSHVEPWLREELSTGGDIGQRIADSRGSTLRWQITTSQAVDIVQGGEKDNALPTHVEATINYRIATHEHIDDVFKRIANHVASAAHRYDVAVSGFGSDEQRTEQGLLRMSAKLFVPASPISPTDQESEVWKIFSGTLRQVFESTETLPNVKTIIPVGSIATSNSDTHHYLNLTRNIYRFTPAREGSRVGIHDIDERIQMSAHVEMVRTYYDLIRNMQMYDGHVCDGKCPSPQGPSGEN